MRYRADIDKSSVSRADKLYISLLKQKYDSLISQNQSNQSGKLIFISGQPRVGTSMFKDIGSRRLNVLDEPASWENGGINEHSLNTLLSGQDICIIRPNLIYVLQPLTEYLNARLAVDVSTTYLKRSINNISKSYEKRSAISKKVKVNWLPVWDKNYAMYEYTDHLRLLSKNSELIGTINSYELLRSDLKEWHDAVNYIYSLANQCPDPNTIRATFLRNSSFTTDTPAEHLELLRTI